MTTAKTVEVFYDYVCPWCYFCTANLERLQKEYGVEYKYTGFPLHPDTPEGGRPLAELYVGRDVDFNALQQRLATVARREGLPFDVPSHTYNSRRAQELGKFAEKLGLLEPFIKSAYTAYFVEGRNIALVDELVQIAKRAGLPEDQARKALQESAFGSLVDDDWDRVQSLGITGVPAFVYRDRVLEGFQPYQHLVEFIHID